MFSFFSYRVLFQRFFPQNISLLPKIVTEAHANLKKKKTSCNTTLKHYAVPLERSSLISCLICQPVVFCFHLFIINPSPKFIWVVVHYCIVHIFPRRTIISWTKRRLGSRTRTSCLLIKGWKNEINTSDKIEVFLQKWNWSAPGPDRVVNYCCKCANALPTKAVSSNVGMFYSSFAGES